MLNKSNLHQYQVKAVNHIISNNGCALFLDMGLGKTVSTLTAIEILLSHGRISKPLIIAPKRVAQSTWSDEIGRWEHLQNLTISKILGSAKDREDAIKANADIYVTNRENVQWLVEYMGNNWVFDMVVIDELSSFKSQSSKRFKALRKVLGRTKRVVGLTGTPTPNGLMDLWSQIYLIDKGERLEKTITKYRQKYFTAGRGSGYIVYDWRINQGAADEIQNKLSDICLSMQAKDYLELPAVISNRIDIKLSDKEMQQYKAFQRERIIELGEEPITATNAAVLSNQLRQFTSGALYEEEDKDKYVTIHNSKIEALKELEECTESSILVGYEFRHELDRIKKAIPHFRTIDTPQDIRDWNDGKIKIAGGHPASMGHGLNLQRGGNVIVWMTTPWSLELYQQFNGRLNRQGQTKPVFVHHLTVHGTIDDRVIKVLQGKDNAQNAILGAIKEIRAELGR